MKQRFEPLSPLVCAAEIGPAMRRRVALVLAAIQDPEGPNFSASLGTQSSFVGLPPDEIQEHVAALAALGVLEVAFRSDCGSPAPLPSYHFNEARLRSLAQQQGRTEDLFSELPAPCMPFLAEDAKGGKCQMSMELRGRPGRRTVHFFLEGHHGDVPYGWGYLRMLLLPSFAKGAWTGSLNPDQRAPAWAKSVATPRETIEELRQWSQVLALGRPESRPSSNNQPALPQGADDSDH